MSISSKVEDSSAISLEQSISENGERVFKVAGIEKSSKTKSGLIKRIIFVDNICFIG